MNSIKNKLLELDNKNKIKFIVLFGSVAKQTDHARSDIDLAVYYDGNKKERFDFRIKALGNLPDNVDLQTFQDLPLRIRKVVLGGKVIYYQDHQFTFDKFMETIKKYDSLTRLYNIYYECQKNKLEVT